MTLDSPLLYRPTDDLILPTHRKFFPLRIPNAHHQLRHYISTADAGRIYVAVGRIINSISTATGKLDVITIVPFDPRCLTAGLGWIAVGGADHGDCAFIKLRDAQAPSSSARNGLSGMSANDVDAALPLDLAAATSRPLPPRLPEVLVHEFGGSIVNSITIHRLPAFSDLFSPEDVAIVTNNDHSVSVFSLTRQEMMEVIPHPACMNYAIISPDSSILAAVGDEHRIYFYRATPCPKRRTSVVDRDKSVCGWEWPLIRSVELDSDSHYNDRCCFTIAFSPSSHLCAVGSQSGIITVFDVSGILSADSEDRDGREDIACVFRSSRFSFEGGSVRSMSFSPRPWDLLVWVEEYGKVGVADIRQAFSRRQILNLELEDPALERVRVENPAEGGQPENSDSDSENRADYQLDDASDAPGGPRRDAALMGTERQAVRENNLSRELTDRERQIVNFLNTAQWASTIEEGPQARLTRLTSPLPRSGSPPQGSQTGNRSPLSSSPPERSTARHESAREGDAGRPRGGGSQPRRRSSVVVSQDNSQTPGASSMNAPNSALVPHPTITLTWTESPSQVPRSDSPLETAGPNTNTTTTNNNNNNSNAGPSDATTVGPGNGQASSSSSSGRSQHGPHRARVLLDRSLGISPAEASGQRQRSQRSRSIPRRADRPDGTTTTTATGDRQEPNLAAERMRLHRQAALEDRMRERQHRQLREMEEQQLRYLRESDQTRATPFLRRDVNDPGIYSRRDRERQREFGVGTAGIGWGEDGHTLYIGTTRGILEYQIDIQDRKTFPGVSFR